jgi:hypothetical protein
MKTEYWNLRLTDKQGVSMYHRLLNKLKAIWQCLHVVDTSAVSGGWYRIHTVFFRIFTYYMDGWRMYRSVR